MSDNKIKTIRNKLKIPANVEIPLYNTLLHYNPVSKQRSEVNAICRLYGEKRERRESGVGELIMRLV